MDYYIRDIDSLKKLSQEKNLKNTIRKIKLSFDAGKEVNASEQKLNKYYFACGCKEGAITVYVVLFCSFILWWSSGFIIVGSWWKFIIVIACAALIGKVTGLIINKYKLKKVLHDLERQLTVLT